MLKDAKLFQIEALSTLGEKETCQVLGGTALFAKLNRIKNEREPGSNKRKFFGIVVSRREPDGTFAFHESWYLKLNHVRWSNWTGKVLSNND